MLKKHAVFLGLLLLGVAVIYLPGLGNDLVFDDERLRDGTIFSQYGALFELKPRLFSYGSFVWLREVLGDGWWKQRVVNLAIHVAVAGSLYVLVRRVLDLVEWPLGNTGQGAGDALARSKDAAAGFGVLVFALNPVAIYAVAYLVQRSILVATLCAVVALVCTIHAAQTGRHLWLLGAAVAFGLALLSKEHAVMLPVVGLALFLIARRPSRRTAVLATAAVLLLSVAGAAFLITRYESILGRVFDPNSRNYVSQLLALSPGIDERIYSLSIVNQAWLFFKYGALWFLPNVDWMSIDLRPPFPLQATALPQVLGVPLYLGLGAGAVFLMARFPDWRRILGFALFLPAALFTTEFATVWVQDPFVLYRSYLWAISVPLLVAMLFVGTRPGVVTVWALVVGAVLAVLALNRVMSLQTEFAVWDDAARKAGVVANANAVGRWRAFLNRGNQFMQRGDVTSALADYEAARRVGDPTGLADYHRGLALQKIGRLAEALRAFSAAEKPLAASQEHAGLLPMQEGHLLYQMQQYDAAIAAIDRALPLLRDKEDSVVALQTRAKADVRLGRTEDAIADFRRILDLAPDDRAARIEMAMALGRLKRGDEAMPLLDKLLAEKDGPDIRFGRAMTLEALGRTSEARVEANRALQLDPRNPGLQALMRKLEGAR